MVDEHGLGLHRRQKDPHSCQDHIIVLIRVIAVALAHIQWDCFYGCRSSCCMLLTAHKRGMPCDCIVFLIAEIVGYEHACHG
jgi:hypothetical protein